MSGHTIDGGPAFPAPDAGEEHFSQRSAYMGMTLRDYFAAKVMQSLLTQPSVAKMSLNNLVANLAYEQADAMLARRAK